MKTKRIIGLILQMPLYLLVLASFIASIYASVNKIAGVSYSTPIILAAIMIAFIIGLYLRKNEKKKPKYYENESYEQPENEDENEDANYPKDTRGMARMERYA
jgi:hypothetical protein